MGIEERLEVSTTSYMNLAKRCLYGATFFVIGGNIVAMGADMIGDNIYSIYRNIDYDGLVKVNLTLAGIGAGIVLIDGIGEKVNDCCKGIATYLRNKDN